MGKVGMAVCYDLRFAGLFQAMGEIDILVLPSAFTQKTGEAHWLPLLKARAIEKQCYLVAANQGGQHDNGRQTFGHSCILSPWGDELALIEKGQGLVSANFDPSFITKIRQQMPIVQHNRFRSHLV
jgi:nitrilase